MKNLRIIWCLLLWWIVGRIIIVNLCRPFWKGSNLSEHIQILCIHCCLFFCKTRLNLISFSFSCISWSSYHKNLLASSDYEGTVILWDGFTGQRSKVYQVNKNTGHLLLLLLFSHSVVSQLFAIPWTVAHQVPCPSLSPEFVQTHAHWVDDAIQQSHPLSSCSPFALNLSQHQGLFQWVSSLHQAAKILELVVRITFVLFNNYRASCVL